MTQSTTADYTPGPWFIAPPGGPQGPFYGMVNPQGNVVATQIVGPANARLIAAAPELLDAARRAFWNLQMEWPSDIENHWSTDLKRELEAAIAKAEPQS